MRKFIGISALRAGYLVIGLTIAAASTAQAGQEASAPCRPTGSVAQMRGLSEASGLVVSRQAPDRLWTHNDSGEPVLFALNADGSVAGQVRITGASVEDWEALAIGACGSGSCLYIGDIGDNEASRRQITVYRVPEPDTVSGTVAVVDVFHATYPDGAHDAEALLVSGDGRLHVITKGESGPIGIYRFPAQLQPGTPMQLERVGTLSAKADAASRVTDAAVSPDGQWAAVRTRTRLTFYRSTELFAGKLHPVAEVDLTPLNEPQGEGVAIGAGNTVFLAGEGGGKGQAGTFARFTCAPRG